jgi:DNA repair exonuclease SbcCD ATPase subunit
MVKFEEQFNKIQDKMTELNELLDSASLLEDGILDTDSIIDGVELPKKKKDKELFLKEKAKKIFPKLVNQIEQLDVALQGVGEYIDDIKSELEDKQDEISEIEDLQQEIEERKDALG